MVSAPDRVERSTTRAEGTDMSLDERRYLREVTLAAHQAIVSLMEELQAMHWYRRGPTTATTQSSAQSSSTT